MLGTLYGQTGDYGEMRQSYRKALNADPSSGSQMIQRLSDFVESTPSAGGYFLLGTLLQEAGHKLKAREAYGKSLTLDPGFEDARAALASVN